MRRKRARPGAALYDYFADDRRILAQYPGMSLLEVRLAKGAQPAIDNRAIAILNYCEGQGAGRISKLMHQLDRFGASDEQRVRNPEFS